MRLTIRLLGCELLDLYLSTDPDEEACSLDGGATAAYPIGFTLRPGEELGARPEWPYGDE